MDVLHTGAGSSADDVDAGNPSTDDPKKSLLDPDESKWKKVDDETNPQAAASDSLECSKCGTCINPKPVEVGEEMKEYYQPASSSDQDGTCEEQMTVEENLQMVLKKLKDVMSKECFKNAEHLVKNCSNKSPTDQKELLKFFILLEKDLKLLHQKSVKARNSSSSSSSSSSHLLYPATVKVYSTITGRTFGAHDVILEQVKKSRLLTVVETTDLQECNIIIVFCPITSRVGSDVEAAMRNITVSSGDKHVILVLMHHTRDVDYSTDVKRWSEIYQNVVLDVHVLFHETLQGLLKCPRNDQAVQQIQKVLNKHSKYRGLSLNPWS